MDERTLIFQKLQKGEVIFTLEKDRRSGYPIFDTVKIVKVGESKPMASGTKDGFVNSIELVIQDSVSQLTIYLPSQSDEGIYNGVYYTTDIVNIINEVTIQKQNALNILNNRPKFEAVVSECDNILNSINLLWYPVILDIWSIVKSLYSSRNESGSSSSIAKRFASSSNLSVLNWVRVSIKIALAFLCRNMCPSS